MTRLMTKLAAFAGVLALAGACVRGDPVSPAGNEEGNALLFTGTATNPSPVLPSGSANVLTNIAVSTSVRDALGRRFAGEVGRRSHYFHTARVHWFWPFDAARGSLGTSPVSTARWDPRYPFLTSDSTTMGRGMHLIIPNSVFAFDDFYELWIEGNVQRVKPITPYQVVFVHYRLKQVGMLDQVERVLRGVVTEPDSLLLPAGSTIGAINTDWTGAAPAGCAPYPVGSNPFVVSTGLSSAGGQLGVDKCWTPNGALATFADGVGPAAQPKFMVGRNDDQAYTVPNYNYIEIWEGTYGSAAGPIYRVQIAQDLDLSGNPIANAFAPFPAPNTVLVNAAASPNLTATGQTTPPPVDRAPVYPLSLAEQIALPGSEGEPDSVILTLNNVEALAGGSVYKVWYVNPTTNAAQAATGKWVRVLGTDTVASSSGTSTFEGGPGQIIFTTDPYGDIGQPDVSDSLSILLVSIEQSGAAASPSTAQPFWVTVLKKVGGAVGGAVSYGEFTLGDDSRGPELFRAQGTMAGGVIGDTVVILVDTTINGAATKIRAAQFVGNRVEVRFTGLMRPPLGYRYTAYLCGSDDGTCSPTNSTTEFFDLGGLMSPSGVSLDNADSAPNDGNMSATRIVSAFASASVSGAQTLCDFDRFRLVLEPIAGGGPPLAHIFDAALPAQLTGARSCR